MEQDKAKKKLYHQLLKITLLPIFLLTAVIITISIRSYANAMNNEVRQGLMNQSFTIITMYDKLYPGDYKAFEGDDGLYLPQMLCSHQDTKHLREMMDFIC